MINFEIQKTSEKSKARLGVLTTPHGEVETPAFVPVATQAVIKTLTSEETEQTGSQILIANTYHLHLKPGEDIVEQAGHIHQFMNWSRPLMTDSGGFQVFSLGFGRDHGVGKILKEKSDESISQGQQPKDITISDDGVTFRSPLDGSELFLGPKESISIQQKIGADIIFAFDEATSPVADEEYTKQSLERTHRWAKASLDARTSDQALFGIVQGGKFKNLRAASAEHISSLPFNGFSIGGEYGDEKHHLTDMLHTVHDILPPEKPRHVLGIGHLEDIPEIIKAGADTFDCIVPTHYARHGTAFVSASEHPAKLRRSEAKLGTLPYQKLDLTKTAFLSDQSPLDEHCTCHVCATYKRSYISHLIRAREITGLKLLTFHNLHYFNNYVAQIRKGIKDGRI